MGMAFQVTYRSVVDNRVATKLDVVLKAQRQLRQEADALCRMADELVRSARTAPRYIADCQDLSQYFMGC
jgi:hypothetical protein